MATSRLERELGRRKARKRAPDLIADPAAGSAPGVPPVPTLMALEMLRRGLPSAPAPGVLPNRAPALPEPVAPFEPIQAPSPWISRGQPDARVSGMVPQAPRVQPLQLPSPVEPMVAPNAPSSYGLTNFAGDPTTQNMLAAFAAAKARSQSTALDPTVASAPQPGLSAPSATPLASQEMTWNHPIPTGPQYPTVYGSGDPLGSPVPGDPVPKWVGNFPRYGMNLLPAIAGAGVGIGGELVKGVGEAAKFVGGAAKEVYRQTALSANERAREDAAAASPPAQAPQPAPAAKPARLSLQPTGPASNTVPVAAPQVPTPASAGAQPAPASAGTTPGPAPTGSSWNNLPPAALEMAQVWQSRGYSDAAIAGMLGQAAGESSYGQNPATVAGGGMFQHQGDRAVARDHFAQHYGLDPNDPTTEALFVDAEMRGDPASGTPATEQYAYQQLMQARDPYSAAAAGLHFERPENYSRANFDPTRVAGWNNRLQGTQAAYNALHGGAPLPPYQPAFRQDMPPAVPNPEDYPMPVAPDYSQVNSWLNQAAPVAPDAGAQRQRRWDEILSGVAQGNAAVDTRGAGGVGRLIAAWGQGATGGKAFADASDLAEQKAYQQEQRGYAGDRAGFAQTEANAKTDWANRAGEVGYKNRAEEQNANYQTEVGKYETTQKNRASQAESNQVNDENLYKWRQDAYTAQQPVQKDTGKGFLTVYPDGSHKYESYDEAGSGGQNATQQLKTMSEIKGDPGEIENYKYLIKRARESGNDNFVTDRILTDVFTKGLGADVFPQSKVIREAVEKDINEKQPTLNYNKPIEYKALVDQTVANEMRKVIASPSTDPNADPDAWIKIAAALGVTGAQMYIQAAGSGGQ